MRQKFAKAKGLLRKRAAVASLPTSGDILDESGAFIVDESGQRIKDET